MKYTNKLTQTSADPIAEARKDKRFFLYSKEARVAIRLAAEVYEKRKQIGWTQARLANEIETTQKVISNIESGDVNIGIDLLKRLADGLTLTTEDLGGIFETGCLMPNFNSTAATKSWSKDDGACDYANKSANFISLNQR